MAGEETILQNWIVADFMLPFLIVFFIAFALLERTKVLGDGKHQINALLSFVLSAVFVSFAYPKEIVGNLVLFLTVALVVIFVGLMLWGFISGGTLSQDFLKTNSLKWTAGIVIVIVVILAVLWAMGIEGGIVDMLFKQGWSETFWTNIAFVGVIVIALAVAIKGDSGGSSGDPKKSG